MRLFTRGLKGKEVQAEIPKSFDSAFISTLLGETVVSKEMIKEIPILKRQVEMVSSLISSLDVHIIKNMNGNIEDICDNRTSILKSQQGKQTIVNLIEDSLIYGSGYAYAEQAMNGELLDINYVDPNFVSVLNCTTDYLHPSNKLCVAGNVVDATEFIKLLSGASEDGLSGTGGLIDNKQIIRLYWSMLRSSQNISSESKKIFRAKKVLTQDAFDKLKADIKALNNSSDGVLILNEGVDVLSTSTRSSQEQQFMELFNKLDDELCIMAGANKEVLLGKSSNEQYNQWIRSSVIPLISRLITALNDTLLTKREVNDGVTFAFNTDNLFHSSAKDKAETNKILIDSGVRSRNEVRQEYGYSKVNGLDTFVLSLGNVLFNPSSGEYINFNMDSISAMKNKAGDNNEITD